MKSIDSEIAEVENRIATRKVAMAMTAAAAKTRTRQLLLSPVTLAGAAVAGFVVAGALWRKKKRRPVRTVERRRSAQEQEQAKGFALGTLAMTGIAWVVRSQFGGPVGLAHFVLEKLRSRAEASGDLSPRVPAESRLPATDTAAHLHR